MSIRYMQHIQPESVAHTARVREGCMCFILFIDAHTSLEDSGVCVPQEIFTLRPYFGNIFSSRSSDVSDSKDVGTGSITRSPVQKSN